MEPPDSFQTGKRHSTAGNVDKADANLPEEHFNVHLTKMVLEASSQQIKKAVSTYTNIDLLRCYFDVTPAQVVKQLFSSVNPFKKNTCAQNDLYGPLMLIFTLVALLLLGMKNSDFNAKDGTLIGTAFATSMGYWCLATFVLIAISIWLPVAHGPVFIASRVGYALFAHCIVLGVGELLHSLHSHVLFHILAIPLGGLSTVCLAGEFYSRTYQSSQKLILLLVVCLLNVGFLYYLHYGFHRVVEEINEILGDDLPVITVNRDGLLSTMQ